MTSDLHPEKMWLPYGEKIWSTGRLVWRLLQWRGDLGLNWGSTNEVQEKKAN